MTLGDFFMYIFFIGLLAAPMISIASIGTQITEAFAGLDRIREIMNMPTEDEDDAGKPSLGEIRGDVTFEDVWFEYNAGRAGAEGRHRSTRRRARRRRWSGRAARARAR